MKLIKYLYEGINFNTIPENIYKELCSHSDTRSFISKRNSDGDMITEYGEKIKPMFMHYILKDNSFFINQKHISNLQTDLDGGRCFDANGVKITRESISPYYIEYGKGFNKGYRDFESYLKTNDSLFSTTNEQISHKVYSRVKRDLFKLNDGRITLGYTLGENNKMLSEIREKYKLKYALILKKDSFFKNGINGGEFYKAWEIILHNPTLFEQFFKEKAEPDNQQQKVTKNTSGFIWFKIGVLFAKGKIQELYNLYKGDKGHFLKITKELGFKHTSRPYISETLNNTTPSDKNLYSNKSKMLDIEKYCKKEGISICDDFQRQLDLIVSD
jgi:hypothetical protein